MVKKNRAVQTKHIDPAEKDPQSLEKFYLDKRTQIHTREGLGKNRNASNHGFRV